MSPDDLTSAHDRDYDGEDVQGIQEQEHYGVDDSEIVTSGRDVYRNNNQNRNYLQNLQKQQS